MPLVLVEDVVRDSHLQSTTNHLAQVALVAQSPHLLSIMSPLVRVALVMDAQTRTLMGIVVP